MKLTKHYINTISRDFILKHNLKNVMNTPRIDKLVIDTGTGAAIQDVRHLIPCVTALEAISGQKPKLTISKKAIANFKLRENQIIGCKVTLRKERFFFFLQKLIYTIILQQNIDFVGRLNFSAFKVGVDLCQHSVSKFSHFRSDRRSSNARSPRSSVARSPRSDRNHSGESGGFGESRFARFTQSRCARSGGSFGIDQTAYDRLRSIAQSAIPHTRSARSATLVEKSNVDLSRRLFDDRAKLDPPEQSPKFVDVSVPKKSSISLGISNILVFPELENHYDLFNAIPGVNLNFCSKNLLPYQLASMTHFLNA